MIMAKFPTYEEMGKKVAEKALDEFLYDGKSIREWMQIIASEDAISRQEMLKYFESWKNQIKYYHPYAKNFDIPYEEAIQRIKDVPPVKCVSSEKPNKCDDAISRQAVLDATVNKNSIWNSITNSKGENLEEIISQLPSVSSLEKLNRWIPVSEGLPKEFRYVNCTCRSLIDDRKCWVVETCYVPQPPNSPYSDWGNIPMLNDGDCEVVAWMYRDIPKPYRAESED